MPAPTAPTTASATAAMASIRSRALQSFEEDRVKRDRIRSIIGGSGVSGTLGAEDLDAEHSRAPYENRKPVYHPLLPKQLAITVCKNVALQGLLLLAKEEPPSIPLHDHAELARYAGRLLAKPVAKDLGAALCQHLFERLAEANWSGSGSDAERGQWTRDPATAARQAALVRYTVLDKHVADGEADSRLAARWDVSRHVALRVIPRTALLLNLALLTVEEVDLLGTALYRWWRKSRAEAVLLDRTAPVSRVQKARAEVAELEAAAAARRATQRDLLSESVLNVVRAAVAVAGEVVLGGACTLLQPGLGTTIGSVLGGVVAWAVI